MRRSGKSFVLALQLVKILELTESMLINGPNGFAQIAE